MIYLDVTSSCKSPMNTGVQRVVRELYRALSAQTPVTPLVWNPGLAAYCTLSRRERGFLENPFDGTAATGDAEPGRRANPIPLWSKWVRSLTHRRNQLDLAAALLPGDTLFVPEIFQDNRAAWLAALPARAAARRVGVCHDALPWRHPELMPASAPSTAQPTSLPPPDTTHNSPPASDFRLPTSHFPLPTSHFPLPAPPRRVGLFYDALTHRRPDLTPPARRLGFAEYLDVLGTFDHIVTISQESAADLRACWRENGRPDDQMPPVSIFPWPVNHARAVRRLVPPPAFGRGTPPVLCVGTFEPRKNHLLLLAAAEQAWRAGTTFTLLLVGRTTAHWGARVESEIARLQAANFPVRWLRHVDDRTLRQAYEDCAFTIFPSLVEGLGLPILESLWYGRPCICGHNGALGEVSAGGGCLPVDQTNSTSLATALTQLLSDEPLYHRLCQEARTRPFGTWEALASNLLPLLVPANEK